MNSLYGLIERQESPSAVTFRIQLNRDHEIFQGHFPGNPLLPGVCTVQIISELLAETLDRDIMLVKASSIKYSSFISPLSGDYFTFGLQFSVKEDGNISCNARVYNDKTAFCTFRGEYREV
jgi:3-hydroxyacyl-[acyl-carrier-protein] dehydratase